MRYKEISKIFDNENFKVVVSEPFNDICIDFIQDLSNVIRKKRNSYKYQDLMYLSLWCSRKKILNFTTCCWRLQSNEFFQLVIRHSFKSK